MAVTRDMFRCRMTSVVVISFFFDISCSSFCRLTSFDLAGVKLIRAKNVDGVSPMTLNSGVSGFLEGVPDDLIV